MNGHKSKKGRAALLIVDVQNDFTKAGTQTIEGNKYDYNPGKLGVDQGYAVIPIINKLVNALASENLAIASQDWHPTGHKSFASSHLGKQPFDQILLNGITQILWPDHCVQNSKGAELMEGLHKERIQHIVKKGQNPLVDSYSVFYDNNKLHHTQLDAYLKERSVKRVYIVGIATDYCVKYSALDAKALGYDVTVIYDACRGVDPATSSAALEELKEQGIAMMTSQEALSLPDFG